jgi:hypothetical protein
VPFTYFPTFSLRRPPPFSNYHPRLLFGALVRFIVLSRPSLLLFAVAALLFARVASKGAANLRFQLGVLRPFAALRLVGQLSANSILVLRFRIGEQEAVAFLLPSFPFSLSHFPRSDVEHVERDGAAFRGLRTAAYRHRRVWVRVLEPIECGASLLPSSPSLPLTERYFLRQFYPHLESTAVKIQIYLLMGLCAVEAALFLVAYFLRAVKIRQWIPFKLYETGLGTFLTPHFVLSYVLFLL